MSGRKNQEQTSILADWIRSCCQGLMMIQGSITEQFKPYFHFLTKYKNHLFQAILTTTKNPSFLSKKLSCTFTT